MDRSHSPATRPKQGRETPSLSWERVTNWRLARGHLARRVARARLVPTVTDMCGAHAQILSSVPLALSARVSGLRQALVDAAIQDERTLVKTWAMRGTLHVFTADDLPLYCAAQRTRDQYMNPSFLKYFELELADIEAVLDAIPRALDGQMLTREELADQILKITRRRHLEDRLRSGWGELLKPAAFRGLMCFGPQSGRSVTFVRPDQWLGQWKEYDTDEALQQVFRRFLAVYGPASREEVARWWGVRAPEAGRVLESLAQDLTQVECGGSKRWVLTSDLRSLKTARAVKGVRLLPSFDQLLVMSAPHSEAIVDAAFKGRIYRARIAVWSLPSVLIDGRVKAAWKLERKRGRAIIRVEPFKPLSRSARSGLEEEAARMGALLDADPELAITPS
ncbi:MAG: winged helix DNA-binding domain-containing protein [Actinomycetota bacterium]|nr:winged helix DNA-binding domain-containing protein [Actinomycetota bacterium]